MNTFTFILSCVVALGAVCRASELETMLFRVGIDDQTGSIKTIRSFKERTELVTSLGNDYRLLSKAGDRFAREVSDRVVSRGREPGWSQVYRCTNRHLPDLEIVKRYRISSNGLLERELEFRSSSSDSRFLQLFTSSHFAPRYGQDGYWFGAGYLGPYLPVPHVRSARRVEEYVQSSKGMVFIHHDGLPSYAHYRTTVNGVPVWPWWNSTIGSYREKNDRLYYLPDGWKMCLGTFNLKAEDGCVRIRDKIGCFKGDMHAFYGRIYGKDPVVRKELSRIQASPCDWLNDVTAIVNFSKNSDMRYAERMLDEGYLLGTTTMCGQWADYRWERGMRTTNGGHCTAEEIQEYFQSLKSLSPRIKLMHYGITVAGTVDAPIYREHPEWFRRHDRRGDVEIHFPRLFINHQTRFQLPEVRRFMSNTLFNMARRFDLDAVYLDEAQQQNTIDWERGDVIQDDHLVQVFRAMRERAVNDGKVCFYNGSGMPYADLNYMEALDQMRRSNWRTFAGVAFGLELFSLLRPESRIIPIAASFDSTRNDYSNRVLALGWLPRYEFPAPLSTVRAAREMGKTLPVPADYAPDWKRDFSVNVESYAVRRLRAEDYVISFINRENRTADVTVELNLASAGMEKLPNVNVWAMKTAHPTVTKPEFWLANEEYRRQVRDYRWYDGFLSVPELIFSGKPSGRLRHTFKSLKVDEMGQLLVTASPAAIFSTDYLPMNYYLTEQKGIRIQGKRIVSTRKHAEVMLADRHAEFADIRLDGEPVTWRTVDVGGRCYQVIDVSPGDHQLTYRRTARTVPAFTGSLQPRFDASKRQIVIPDAPKNIQFALVQDGRTRLTATSPLQLPEQYRNGVWQIRPAGMTAPIGQVMLSGGRKSKVSYQALPQRPERKSDRSCCITKNGLRVTRASSHVLFRQTLRALQDRLDPAEASADPEGLRLIARSTRREDTLDARFYAGLEISGAREIALRLTSHFYGQYTLGHGYEHHVYGGGVPKIDFSGLVIDYRVNGTYAKRVAVTCGIGRQGVQNALPTWGCGRQYDVLLSLGNLIDRAPVTAFRFPVADYAPEGWDGTFFLSLGNTHILPSRGLEIQILGKGEEHAGLPLFRAVPPNQAMKRSIPATIALGRLSKRPRPKRLLDPRRPLPTWTPLPPLEAVYSVSRPVQRTIGMMAYDSENLYILAEATEKERKVIRSREEPWNNDSLEVYVVRPGASLMQIVMDAGGRIAVLENGNLVSEHALKGMSQIIPGQGFRVFLVIPWKELGMKEIYPGHAMRFNLARSRCGVAGHRKELSSVAPVKRLFSESGMYGKFQLGRTLPGIGKFEEFSLGDGKDHAGI